MIWKLLSKQCKTQMLHYLQAMQMPFFLIQCPIDTSLDISRGVVYKKLPQAPQQFTDMIVEIAYIH